MLTFSADSFCIYCSLTITRLLTLDPKINAMWRGFCDNMIIYLRIRNAEFNLKKCTCPSSVSKTRLCNHCHKHGFRVFDNITSIKTDGFWQHICLRHCDFHHCLQFLRSNMGIKIWHIFLKRVVQYILATQHSSFCQQQQEIDATDTQ